MRFITADCRVALRALPSESVQCVVTSPPYWGLRSYGIGVENGELGLEQTPEAYVGVLVAVFDEVHRVLRDDGVLWLNLGDSYINAKGQAHGVDPKQPARRHGLRPQDVAIDGYKAKDLVGIPWMVAFALRAAGWWLRQDIIWAKPNPMPESVLDRCTKSHEYMFMLTKSARYLYDAAAIREPAVGQNDHDLTGTGYAAPGQTPQDGNRIDKQRGHGRRHAGFNDRWDAMSKAEQGSNGRNRRSVWPIAPQPFAEAHFATFPPALVEPCLLATAGDGPVLDPFGGAGTTALVADRLGLDAISIDANAAYTAIAERRLAADRERREREAPLTLASL